MTLAVDHIAGQTYHGRRGAVRNAFRYTVDYVMLDAEAEVTGPSLFSRNKGNLTSLHDSDHGGAPAKGKGPPWVREVLRSHQLPQPERIMLLAQPRVLGHVFNPVSFWLGYDAAGDLTSVIAEVSNTFGDRHSYLCHTDGSGPIGPDDTLLAKKIFHVSPFQSVEGGYEFKFDIRDHRIGIRIDYKRKDGGLIATLAGPRAPLTNRKILRAVWRRPFGSRRVLTLIHWQALKLWVKRATFRARPKPPGQEVSRG